MRINFRQGIISYQSNGFLRFNGSGNVDCAALNRPVTLTLAHKQTNYTHSEDNDVVDAWVGPFAASTYYWLYWDFDKLTFDRTFGITTLEPVAQSAEPGNGNSDIVDVTPGLNGVGSFQVQDDFVLPVGRMFAIIGSTGNDGTYTTVSSAYNIITGRTTIVVAEDVLDATPDGEATLDIDSAGIPLLQTGRMWYDTTTNTHYEWSGSQWVEVLRVFGGIVVNGNTFVSWSIGSTGGSFSGTQIGDTGSTTTGRILFGEGGQPIRRDNGTWFTTEDQFFTNQSRVDALRLESNVARAQSNSPTIAAFQPVAWTSDGRVQSAVYEDVGNTVIGIMTEPVLFSDVGAIIIQGVVTNPDWNWTDSVPVGTELFVDNGNVVAYDPNIVDPINHPVKQVPVGRVLSRDTIVFEQGLGGVGPTGPTGTLDDLPPATANDLGGVTLVTPSSDPTKAFVISDTDVRLSDARLPLPHTHQGTDISVLPTGDVTSNNVQDAIAELAADKVAIAGDIMTGPLTLYGTPLIDLHAATKRYVDSRSIGLVWIPPIDGFINLISDGVIVPPLTPNESDVYIVGTGGLGDWAGLDGHVVQSTGGTGSPVAAWADRGHINTFASGTRFGVAMETPTVPGGSFTGKDDYIMTLTDPGTGTFDSGYVPNLNDAVFVSNGDSGHAYHQYVFEGAEWVEFGGAQAFVPDNLTIEVLPGNIVAVIPASSGGLVDAKYVEGFDIAGLDLRYSALGHTHSGVYSPVGHTHDDNEVITTGDVSSLFGTPTDLTSIALSATDVETNLVELNDNKALRMPTYATAAGFPIASASEGMYVYAQDTKEPFYSDGIVWNKLSIEGHTHTLNLPYDLSFFVAGVLVPDVVVGSFGATRNISIPAGATGSIALADTTIAVAQPSNVFDVQKNGVSVGTITFVATSPNGVISIAGAVSLAAGDKIQIVAPATVDVTLQGLTITLVGCAAATPCTI